VLCKRDAPLVPSAACKGGVSRDGSIQFASQITHHERGFTDIALKHERGFTDITLKRERGFTDIVLKRQLTGTGDYSACKNIAGSISSAFSISCVTSQ